MPMCEIFNYFDTINGIIVENDNNHLVFRLFGDDMMFWTRGYNSLDEDKDYKFFIVGEYANHLNLLEVKENVFIDAMRTLEIKRDWKNNRFGVELEKNENKRIHKFIKNIFI